MTERRRNEKLTNARLEAGYSQERLAEKLPIPMNAKSVGRWETDFVIPHPDTQKAVAKLLGKSPQELGFFDRPLRTLKLKKRSHYSRTCEKTEGANTKHSLKKMESYAL